MSGDRRAFRRAAVVNVAGNVVKIAVEGAAGLLFGSVALLADAAHSVADLVASVVVLGYGDKQYEGPDETHPHGHQRIEPLTALFVAVVIILLGGRLLFTSVSDLRTGVDVVFSWYLIGALSFAMVDMYLVYRYTEYVNADLESTALTALAHDCLNDMYTSAAAVVGVTGVLVDIPVLDPLAGAIVSLLVVYQGLEIASENIPYVVGASPSEDERQAVASALKSKPGVEGIHDLAIYYDGTDVEVEVHIEVDGELTLEEAHGLETRIIEQLREQQDVGDVHLHLDPSGIGEWKDAIETR